jgi:cation transport protein ChaC
MNLESDNPSSRSTPPGGCGQDGGEYEGGEFRVFAYGSLMWRPDFDFVAQEAALLRGYHRSMCILSHLYRGTAEKRGLVLGLDRGGSCRGRAFLVAPHKVAEVRHKLYEREMVTGVYIPRFVPVTLADGRKVTAWAFVADRRHPQYFDTSDTAEMIRLIRQGVGHAGSSRDYLASTVEQLGALGIREGRLHRLLELVDRD